MSYYVTRTNHATVAAADTSVHMRHGTGARIGLCEYIISSDATPNEATGEFQVVRTSTTGTTPVATLTVEKVDEYSPATGVTAEGNGYATEPTVLDIMMDVNVHQKATFRWVAYPGREIKSIVQAAGGIGIVVIGQTGTGAPNSINVSTMWME
jgi:hypothetical protein